MSRTMSWVTAEINSCVENLKTVRRYEKARTEGYLFALKKVQAKLDEEFPPIHNNTNLPSINKTKGNSPEGKTSGGLGKSVHSLKEPSEDDLINMFFPQKKCTCPEPLIYGNDILFKGKDWNKCGRCGGAL